MRIHPWVEKYIRLALQIDRSCRHLGWGNFVDHYYGPREIPAELEKWPAPRVDELVQSAMDLADSLPAQVFEPDRAALLEKQIRALETFGKLLAGQPFRLQEAIPRCLDIRPEWVPEADFEQARDLLDQALPGGGSLHARFQTFQERMTIQPADPVDSLAWMEQILEESRKRTRQIVDLPPGERLQLSAVRGKPYGAANWYLGDFQSRIELSVDRPINLFSLIYQMCHEGYPGHHTEFISKEDRLFRERGWVEQSIYILGPQLVISEGIASLAMEMVFTNEEIAAWMAELVRLRRDSGDGMVEFPGIVRALAANMLDDLGGNLVIMMHRGHSTREILDFSLAHTPYSETQVRRLIGSLRTPLQQIYAFTYAAGKRLLHPMLQREDRSRVYRRLLTQPVYPSLLAGPASPGGP